MTRFRLLRSLWRNGSNGSAQSRRGMCAEPENARPTEKTRDFVRRKKMPYEKYGIEDSNAQELQRVAEARREVDKWIYHPTFFSMLSEDAGKSAETRPTPPGEGPILRWTTCIVFPCDGTSWHPRNRKVKLQVNVQSLGLKSRPKRRLLDIVENRYCPKTDTLTLNVNKYEDREDNRKEALRILYNLLEEATTPMASQEDEPESVKDEPVEDEPVEAESPDTVLA